MPVPGARCASTQTARCSIIHHTPSAVMYQRNVVIAKWTTRH
jgi:hypothetical protein